MLPLPYIEALSEITDHPERPERKPEAATLEMAKKFMEVEIPISAAYRAAVELGIREQVADYTCQIDDVRRRYPLLSDAEWDAIKRQVADAVQARTVEGTIGAVCLALHDACTRRIWALQELGTLPRSLLDLKDRALTGGSGIQYPLDITPSTDHD